MFRKLDLFPSSGKTMVAPALLGPLERASTASFRNVVFFKYIRRWTKPNNIILSNLFAWLSNTAMTSKVLKLLVITTKLSRNHSNSDRKSALLGARHSMHFSISYVCYTIRPFRSP
jgi:hypothetical protein